MVTENEALGCLPREGEEGLLFHRHADTEGSSTASRATTTHGPESGSRGKRPQAPVKSPHE